MKNIVFFIIVAFLLSACSGNKSSSVDLNMIKFDVTKTYPVNQLDIYDIADVSYVILEADEDFLFDVPKAVLSENFIIVNPLKQQSFLFFDRTGEPISKVSRRGDGPEEYVRAERFLYVEKEDNLYLVSWLPDDKPKIRVYSKDGVFKRDYSTPLNMRIDAIYDYNDDLLLLYFADQQTPFGLFSKADGSVTLLTDIFIEKPEDMQVRFTDAIIPGTTTRTNGFFYFFGFYVVKNNNDLLLTEYGRDTIYRMTPDKQLSPALIRRPSVDATDPKIAVHPFIESSEYLFFSSVRREYDQEQFKAFPKTAYLIDKSNGQVYTQQITNKDYEDDELTIDPNIVNTFLSPNVGIVYYSIDKLTQANEKGKLKGKLKELFDQMSRDDEFIHMIFQLK